jgi:hypothetical protein
VLPVRGVLKVNYQQQVSKPFTRYSPGQRTES